MKTSTSLRKTRISKPRTVKLRANGKHPVKGATINAPNQYMMQRILRPQAQYRWLMPSLAAITPQYVEMVLMAGLAGSTFQQWQLFDIMLKTWPELLQCYNELVEGVLRKKLIYEPYQDDDENPSPSADERCKLISCALRGMKPTPTSDGQAIEGTIKDLLDAWFRGVAVQEVTWHFIEDANVGTIEAPKETFSVDPGWYGFDGNGVLGLANRKKSNAVWPYSTSDLQPSPSELQPFPENKFLIAMHKASAGPILGGALLRPLAWWWCAANFSSDWLLNLAQVFGLPFRWANYDVNAPQATIDAICTMLQNMGSAGWAAFPTGTTLEMIQPNASQGSDHSPQGELLDRADRYARSLILGQTMTGNHGTTGKGGGQAFGEVEKDVKSDRIDAAGKFVCEVINQQLIPSILVLNYGDSSEAPSIRFLEDEEADYTEAQRDGALAKMGLEIGVDFLRKKYGIPKPAEGEETIGGEPELPPGFQSVFDQTNDQQQQDQQTDDEPAKAGDKQGHEFHGNQYEKHGYIHLRFRPGDVVDTPFGRGVVKHAGDKGVFVSFRGKHRFIQYEKLKKQPTQALGNESEFPLHSFIQSGDAPGHEFRGNQYVALGSTVKTPNGEGTVVATEYDHVWVSTPNGIRRYPKTQIQKVAKDKSNFPGISHSAENERRNALNEQLRNKLGEIAAIEDDALYSKALLDLTSEIEAAGDKPGHEFHGNQWTNQNKKWDFQDSEQIGTITHPTTSLWRKTPGDFTASLQAAAHYAKKQNVPMQVVKGNSYGHSIFNIDRIHDDAVGKNMMGNEATVHIVTPDGKVYRTIARKKTTP